jgi:hypothetical protein
MSNKERGPVQEKLREMYLDAERFNIGKASEEAWKHFYFTADFEMQMQRQHLHAWNSGLWTWLCSRLQHTKQQIQEAPSR